MKNTVGEVRFLHQKSALLANMSQMVVSPGELHLFVLMWRKLLDGTVHRCEIENQQGPVNVVNKYFSRKPDR